MLVPLDVEVYEVLPVVDALTRDLCRHDALVDMDHLAGLVLSHDLAESCRRVLSHVGDS